MCSMLNSFAETPHDKKKVEMKGGTYIHTTYKLQLW